MPTKKPRNPDHVRRNTPQPDNDAITKHLQDLLSPAIYAQSVLPKFGTQRADQPNIDGRGGVNPNLRSTVSTGVKPDVRATGIVVGKAVKVSTSIVTKVSQFSSRVWACFSWLAATVTSTLAPKAKRPLPVAVKYAHKHFENIWIADGSTLEALFRKLESLQDAPQGKLAGKLCTVIDLLTRLPVQVWFHTNPLAHDTNFLADLLNFTPASTLILDRGFYDFGFFVRLIAKQVDFITRIKSNAAFEVEFWVPTTRLRPFDLLQNRWQKPTTVTVAPRRSPPR